MDAIPVAIGNSHILIETSMIRVKEELNEYGMLESGAGENRRNIHKNVGDAYSQLRGIIADIARDVTESVTKTRESGPAEITVELGLSFSGGANAWVITASNEVACKISMKWINQEND